MRSQIANSVSEDKLPARTSRLQVPQPLRAPQPFGTKRDRPPRAAAEAFAARIKPMTHLPNLSLEDLDKAALFHPATSIADLLRDGPAIYDQAKGVRVTTRGGDERIDMGAGLWCVNVGFGREELAEAGAKAMRTLSYQHLFGGASCEDTIRLADRLLTLFREQANAPHMARVFFGTSGSDANDTAFKLVRYYNNMRGKPLKKKIISRIGAYHGVTLASGSLTGIASYHKAFDLPLEGVLHTSCPHYYSYGEPGESEEAFTDRMVGRSRGADRARGRGHRRRLHRRAGHGHGRGVPSRPPAISRRCRRCWTATTSC